MTTKVVDWLADTLRKLGCEEKKSPGTVSSARTLAYLWGLTAVGSALILVLASSEVGTHDVAIVAEMIAGALTALGLRSKADTQEE